MEHAEQDEDLLKRARGGDRNAFGELVRRHRATAFDWARRVAQDPHLAEDIVQEALLRAFLHLGTLAELDRFLPWLHRIVRNEALMKLRKGEHSGRERSFTELVRVQYDTFGADWTDLENILHVLGKRQKRMADSPDPSVILARKEFLETIRQLLRCLTSKERAVFEAHFFRQLSPQEIARLFRTTPDNVYQSLSRARHKVKEERVRIRLEEYIDERRDPSVPANGMLSVRKGPGSGKWKRCKTSFAGAVYAALPYAGNGGYSLSDVMGLTGQAFRLTVEEERIDATGPTMYFWESKFRDGLLNLGLETEHAGDGGAPPTPFLLNKGIARIRHSIMQGVPAIAWDLYAPEFGLVYGYDDAKQLLFAEDAQGKGTIPYSRLGRGVSGGLFVLAITGTKPIGEWAAVKHALEMAIRHAYGEMTFVGYACGSMAYDCWKEAFRKRRVDPLGNAYVAEVAADARAHAVLFLTSLEEKLAAAGREEAAAVAAEAAARYRDVLEAMTDMCRLFPFPSGGMPNDPKAAEAAIGMLERACLEEAAGVEVLERLNRYVGMMLGEQK